jgi:hypothetical protein
VSGDTNDVRAYALTQDGGTALILFNLNETTAIPVSVAVAGSTESSAISVFTYDRAIYDKSRTNVWAGLKTAKLGARSLPVTLSLTPWSMNVVRIGP